MQHTVYSLTFGDDTVYYGHAEDPTKAFAEAKQSDDALGLKIRTHPPVTFACVSPPLTLEAAENLIDALPKTEWDVGVQTTFSSKVEPIIRPWATQECAEELYRSFFWSENPLDALEGDTLEEVIDTFFSVMCVNCRTWVSHGCVYDTRYRVAVIKTSERPWVKEMTPSEFGALTAPWLTGVVEALCHRIVAGTRNDANKKYDAPAVLARATEVLKMYEKENVDAILKKKRNKIVAALLETFVDAAGDVLARFEKLRRLYPKSHPRQPNYDRYKQKIRDQLAIPHDSRPLLNLTLLEKGKKDLKKTEEEPEEA